MTGAGGGAGTEKLALEARPDEPHRGGVRDDERGMRGGGADGLAEPRGLLAAGGRLDVEWLLVAYRQGIFPWFSDNEPILWWTPVAATAGPWGLDVVETGLGDALPAANFLDDFEHAIFSDACFRQNIVACSAALYV